MGWEKMTVAPARLTGGNKLACELKISLDEIRPSIWRIVVVPLGIPLSALHEVFQIAMGWTNSHLHEFVKKDQRYGPKYKAFMDVDDESIDERGARSKVLSRRRRISLATSTIWETTGFTLWRLSVSCQSTTIRRFRSVSMVKTRVLPTTAAAFLDIVICEKSSRTQIMQTTKR